MKYNQSNAPIVCFQSQSTCYRGTKPMTVRGILWHSTGANNPNLSRYIQPSDTLALRAHDTYKDRDEALRVIGKNKYNNDLNHKERSMGMNAWIGKLADGTVATVQTMPWNWAPWGCGAGSRGSCNDGWIQFETAEDGLSDPAYAMQAYQESVELTAYLCKMFNIDPHGYVTYKGVKVPTIIDHKTSHALGLGNNHGDIAHWYPKFGKSMETVRDDVAAVLAGASNVTISAPAAAVNTYPTLRRGSAGEDVKKLQNMLLKLGYSVGTVDGQFGSTTESVVKLFQGAQKLTIDGIVGKNTWMALDAALQSKETPIAVAKTYIATISGLTNEQAQELKTKYSNCEIKEVI